MPDPVVFEYRVAAGMPQLAWVARVTPEVVEVTCGSGLRTEPGGFFEGTWAGAPELASLSEATTVFGSGMISSVDGLLIVPPSHHLEGVYVARSEGALLVSNSLVGILTATGVELDPKFDYPSHFAAATAICWLTSDESGMVAGRVVAIPTLSTPVTAHFVENLLVGRDLDLRESAKPREPAFASFNDYRERLTEATTSMLANAAPHTPLLTLSSGYDSTAVAVVAAAAGVTEAVGLRTSRPSKRDGSFADTGADTARHLGLDYEVFERLSFREAEGMPEAEFLANGSTGEDIIFKAFEERLGKTAMLTGYWAGTLWAFAHPDEWKRVAPTTMAGAGLGEFRLRTGFYHVAPATFGSLLEPGAPSLLEKAELEPYRVGGHYDRPIPRRIAEEAGLPRGSFGQVKRASNVPFQLEGPATFSKGTWRSLGDFAAAEGRQLSFRRRVSFSRGKRALLAAALKARLAPLARPLQKQRIRLVHFEPEFGNLVFRWAVSVVAPRYAAVKPSGE